MTRSRVSVLGYAAALTAAVATLNGMPVARASSASLTAPTIVGAPYKGSALRCSSATPLDTATVVWLWARDGIQTGTTTDSYVVAGADVGHRVSCTEEVTVDGARQTATSAEVEIVLMPVQIRDDTRRRQPGPTLTVRGEVTADGRPAAGTVSLVAFGRAERVTVARRRLGVDGRFSLSETLWNMVPGRYRFEAEFDPADPQLEQAVQQSVTVEATSPATYPFPRSRADRRPTVFDGLPAYWADGAACSVGCRPRGALPGWPLRPFHEQHALRAGFNELRGARSPHVGIDIMALEGQKVYAIQSGYAHILVRHGVESRVRVGNYIYWHVVPLVHEGQYVDAYRTVVGHVDAYWIRHVHLSEVDRSGRYVNPLRPGGRVLAPWSDHEPPVIGRPAVYADGTVIVAVFDPQSYAPKIYYPTPVLAPAALAYRLFRANGTPLGPLEWALRGSQLLSPSFVPAVFAPDARSPGFWCFAMRPLCIPRWRYRVAGGVAARLRLSSLHIRFRLTVYAWDWAGNTTARDTWIHGR